MARLLQSRNFRINFQSIDAGDGSLATEKGATLFKLSKGSEYAIAGLIYMASKPASYFTGIEEIARATGISRQYLAKLFRTLAARGLISSTRGRDGGVMLSKEPGAITLLQGG